jgi:hypothetical protein
MIKNCKKCGAAFKARSNSAKYCQYHRLGIKETPPTQPTDAQIQASVRRWRKDAGLL